MQNNIFKQFQKQQEKPDFNKLYGNFKADPVAALRERYNLPANIGTDPNNILNYLVQSGQIDGRKAAVVNQMYSRVFGAGRR